MNECKYLIGKEAEKCRIKIIGFSTYATCQPLKNFIYEIIENKTYSSIEFDLTETETLDSTNLGLLAKCAEYLREFNMKPIIYSLKEDIDKILESVGFDKYFKIKHEKMTNTNELKPLPENVELDRASLADMLLDTHRSLIKLDGNNQRSFNKVIRLLEKRKEKVVSHN